MEIKWVKETKQTLRSIEETKLKEFEGQVMANIDLLHDYYANIQASFQRYGPPPPPLPHPNANTNPRPIQQEG